MFYTLLDDCAIVSQACLESLISKKISGNGFGIFFFVSYWHFSLKLWVKNIIIIEHAFFCQKTLIFLPTNTQFLFRTPSKWRSHDSTLDVSWRFRKAISHLFFYFYFFFKFKRSARFKRNFRHNCMPVLGLAQYCLAVLGLAQYQWPR